MMHRCTLVAKQNLVETHTVVEECEMYKEGRDVLEEMRQTDECDVEKFSTAVDNSEKNIAILGDRWWPQNAKQEGDQVSKTF